MLAANLSKDVFQPPTQEFTGLNLLVRRGVKVVWVRGIGCGDLLYRFLRSQITETRNSSTFLLGCLLYGELG